MTGRPFDPYFDDDSWDPDVSPREDVVELGDVSTDEPAPAEPVDEEY